MKTFKKLIIRCLSPIISTDHFRNFIPNYIRFLNDWKKYSKIKGAEKIKLIDIYPCIHDKTTTSIFDPHYFYQNIWAFRKIHKSKCKHHVDIGSRIDFVSLLTVITKVTFIDIRPLLVNIDDFESKRGNIINLPFKSNSIYSLSCLHVAEHVGLGRYGDPLDPEGTKKAIDELSRVLAPDGNLYFSLPIGKPKLCFNAHRIHSTRQILNFFSNLELIELSGVTDSGEFIRNIKNNILDFCDYGCGLFWFKKNK
ncbi:MAG: DUF268 domain-containing protein [Candidatus Helarchaeota archaeon]